MDPERQGPPDEGIDVHPDGRVRFQGDNGALYRALDARLARLAADSGAAPVTPASTIAGFTLERAGYFEAFPAMALPATDGGDQFYTPAACYHVYEDLQGSRLDGPRLMTLISICGRRETREEHDAGRLRQFRMREIVFVGAAPWVERLRSEWMDRALALASSIGLESWLEPATDTFFGEPGRGRRLLQQVKQLKFELRTDAGRFGTLAIASFNLHDAFFTRRFDIAMLDGSAAASGCAAFGIERWTLACLEQVGSERALARVAGG